MVEMEGCGVCTARQRDLRGCALLAQQVVGSAGSHNVSGELARFGAPVWLLRIAWAVVAMWDCSSALRVVRSAIAETGSAPAGVAMLEIPVCNDWGQLWCGFLCSLQATARALPPAGLVKTALNRSAADIAQGELPGALAPALRGLAYGGSSWVGGGAAVHNATLVLLEYIECAMLLGEEALRLQALRLPGAGLQPISRAVFHGEATAAGLEDGRISRGDVLLWVLDGGDLSAESRRSFRRPVRPRVAELGVNLAKVSDFMLRERPGLRWLGVDPYLGRIWTPGGERREGSDVLKEARAMLAPHGERARLIVAKSSDVSEEELGPEPFDLVFVDAAHDEASAAADLATWAPRVRPGGIVAGHDFRRHYKGVVVAAHAALPPGATLHLAPDAVFWWRVPLT